MMYEAAQTHASPAGIWAIVVVAVACLAFWLIAIMIAARNPGVNHPPMPGPRRLPGPVMGGTHVSDCGRSVAPSRRLAATLADAEASALVPGQRAQGADPLPATPMPTAPVPTQRTGAADRPTEVSQGV